MKNPLYKILKTKNCVPFEVQYYSRQIQHCVIFITFTNTFAEQRSRLLLLDVNSIRHLSTQCTPKVCLKVTIKVKCFFIIVSPLMKGPAVSDYETPQLVTFTSQIPNMFCLSSIKAMSHKDIDTLNGSSIFVIKV